MRTIVNNNTRSLKILVDFFERLLNGLRVTDVNLYGQEPCLLHSLDVGVARSDGYARLQCHQEEVELELDLATRESCKESQSVWPSVKEPCNISTLHSNQAHKLFWTDGHLSLREVT